jgi:surface antigen
MMFKGAESVVKNLTALGKSLILASVISTSAIANDVWNPKFFEYNSNGVVSRAIEFSFGWNKKLSEEQKLAYHQSVIHALEYADNNQKVKWYRDNASGYTVPVMTWPKSDGYCRRLHINVIAFNKQKAMSVTACYNNMASNWTWYSGK